MLNLIRAGIQKIMAYFKNASIQHIISISFTGIAVTGMIIVGGSLYLRYINSTEDMVSENNKSMLDQVNLNLDSYLRNMMKVSDATYYNVIKKKDLAVESLDKELDLLYETNKDSLISICVFSQKGEVVAASPVGQLKSSVDPRINDWFSIAVNKKENLHFSTPHVQNLFADPDNKYRWVVSLSRAVELTNNKKTTSGVLLVDINFSGIEQICKNVNVGKSGYVYLIDREGEIIYHPRQQLIYSNLIEENNKYEANYEDGNHIETFQGEKRLVTVKTVGYTGWKIVGVTPMTDITSDYYQMSIFAVFIMFFAIFILVFLNMFVSSRIANPIKSLEKCVKKLENGVKDVDISISGSYEIQHLGKAIKSMVNQMHTLMDNIMTEQESKRKSELNALQAQINPHFLYNTLDSIIWMIENENYDGAITMVTALAKLFRISLSKGKNIITVRDEIEHARNYLTIQNIRYKNKFIYNIEVEEETLDLASIKLIIQPLIENAIYHGMEFMGGDGEILVKAYAKEKELYIDVIDNGLGMLQEIADTLLTNESKIEKKSSGIGLKNVHERIQLYFGKNYGLEIYSEPDEGTTIRIHMPCVNYFEMKKEGEVR
ncbi:MULTISPECIES: sensor histidine kinase [unclassified Clostridium]|uniref:sensor histidine kinase n=1 Tax=unclassified Clostridium TaxID=2614128 RepID=UPI000297872F|nr:MULTISPECIES: sensor histidine kinase [unclassified Clostridium]EKQ51029.1 MAG: putative signal transduction protein [Clostridium sp. Maddingley MBC34-26]